MKGITKFAVLVSGVVLALLCTSCEDSNGGNVPGDERNNVGPSSVEGQIISDEYIVHLKRSFIAPTNSYVTKDFGSRVDRAQFMNEKGAIIIEQLNAFLLDQSINPKNVMAYYTAAITGFAIKLTETEFETLSNSNKIASLEYNRVNELPGYEVHSVSEGTPRAQVVPCGVIQAGGSADGSKKGFIWIVDSGIDLDHPDLNVQTSYSQSFIGGTAEDNLGHGTHIAGIAAAKDNSFGVVGVAAGAPVVSLKIFDGSGASHTAAMYSALDHVLNNGFAGDVINIATGSYVGTNCATASPFNAILDALSNANIRVAMAAGNQGTDASVYQPSCVNKTDVFTVVSMDCEQVWSPFSNFGHSTCDYIATGSNVYSTYLNGGYATFSGTSMAAPHVAGIMQIRNDKPATGGFVYQVASTPFNRVMPPYPIAVL